MAVATFDTLKFANTLKAAGVPAQQAEAQAAAFAEVVQVNFKDLVTRDDLAVAVREIRQEVALVEQRLIARIDASDARHRAEQILLRWMIGVNTAFVLAVMGLLVRFLFVPPR